MLQVALDRPASFLLDGEISRDHPRARRDGSILQTWPEAICVEALSFQPSCCSILIKPIRGMASAVVDRHDGLRQSGPSFLPVIARKSQIERQVSVESTASPLHQSVHSSANTNLSPLDELHYLVRPVVRTQRCVCLSHDMPIQFFECCFQSLEPQPLVLFLLKLSRVNGMRRVVGLLEYDSHWCCSLLPTRIQMSRLLVAIELGVSSKRERLPPVHLSHAPTLTTNLRAGR